MSTKKKLMLIDDDEAVLAYLYRALSGRYAVVTTSRPPHAVEMAAAEQPDAILCDIDMPRMNGGEVSKALAADARTAGIPLIFLTSLVTPSETEVAGGYVGDRPGVSKAAPMAEILASIEGALARGS
jgi:CheY-like chemotaxis protein